MITTEIQHSIIQSAWPSNLVTARAKIVSLLDVISMVTTEDLGYCSDIGCYVICIVVDLNARISN